MDHEQPRQLPWSTDSPSSSQRGGGALSPQDIPVKVINGSPLATVMVDSSSHVSHSQACHSSQTGDPIQPDDEEDSDDLGEEDQDAEEEDQDGEDEEEDQEEEPWMDWFLRLPGHHLYLPIPEDYLRDDFNLTDLSSKVPLYRAALSMLLNDPIRKLVYPLKYF